MGRIFFKPPPERGHSCPQRVPRIEASRFAPKSLCQCTLQRTGMSALRTGGSIQMGPGSWGFQLTVCADFLRRAINAAFDQARMDKVLTQMWDMLEKDNLVAECDVVE